MCLIYTLLVLLLLALLLNFDYFQSANSVGLFSAIDTNFRLYTVRGRTRLAISHYRGVYNETSMCVNQLRRGERIYIIIKKVPGPGTSNLNGYRGHGGTAI